MAMTMDREQLLAPDLENYRGQWVAIKDGEIVAAAKDASDLIAELRQSNIAGAALHRVAEHPDNALIL